MQTLTIQPISYVEGIINLPGSKSISNRVLLLSALAKGQTILTNLLDSTDIFYMLKALKILGVEYQLSNNRKTCIIKGIGNFFDYKKGLEIFLGNAGTAIRPLTAVLSLSNNDIVLTGDPRMKKRPILHLIQALQQGGAKIEYLEQDGYPPIKIKGGFYGSEHITLDCHISSQFLTAILIAAPLASHNSIIQVKGNLASKPYVDITLRLMRDFGVEVENEFYYKFYIKSQQQYISPGEYVIEGDASSASYFLAAAAIKGGIVRVQGVGKNSLQGDIKFADVLKEMGAKVFLGKNFIECKRNKLIGIDMDLNEIPDVAMTIAILGIFADGETIIRNIYNWRVKESDRLSAMAFELRKLGVQIKEGYDYIQILAPKKLNYAKIMTYNDHRIAMCFSLIALSNTPVTIVYPDCVAKTFPKYFEKLEMLSYR
ncbi:3-phosphoshikimate 1-carboxyvinyltransferase [Arsenophonus symbiont of Ornithomya chloropus]|uniref:3-phosphoshikimate 1-carboxyvinyltransferase n=1 Tax=Arsenophonus symbiont of Ornithomya chloropus TaxID=634121 RepID=UPI0032B18A08